AIFASFTLPLESHDTLTSTRPRFGFFDCALAQHAWTRGRNRFGTRRSAVGLALPFTFSIVIFGLFGYAAPGSASAPSDVKSSWFIVGPGHGSQVEASHAYSVTIAFGFFSIVRSKSAA